MQRGDNSTRQLLLGSGGTAKDPCHSLRLDPIAKGLGLLKGPRNLLDERPSDREVVLSEKQEARDASGFGCVVLPFGERPALPLWDRAIEQANQPHVDVAARGHPATEGVRLCIPRPEVLHPHDLEVVEGVDRPGHGFAVLREVTPGGAQEDSLDGALRHSNLLGRRDFQGADAPAVPTPSNYVWWNFSSRRDDPGASRHER